MDSTTILRPASRRALADLQYNSIIADQNTTSSEDESQSPGSREMRGEEARSAIGVSIGRQQTRFTSPRTPATEKAAIIDREGGFFGSLDGTTEDDGDQEERAPIVNQQQIISPDAQIPSPWRVPDPKPLSNERSSRTKAILQNGFFTRKRSWSGPDSWLPSLSKNFTVTSPFSSSSRDGSSSRRSTLCTTTTGDTTRDVSPQQLVSSSPEPAESRKEREEAHVTVGDLPTNLQLQRIKSRDVRPPQLRRSTSDNSLVTRRTLSRVSSLGDDTRFEHIQEQV